MALTKQFETHIRRSILLANQILELQHQLLVHRAQWDQNDMFNQLTDPDIQEVADLEHLTVSEVANAFVAFDAISVTALGDFSTGNAVHLIKMKG